MNIASFFLITNLLFSYLVCLSSLIRNVLISSNEMKNVSIFSTFSIEDNGLKNKKIHSTFAVFSVASISSRTWIASNFVLELDAANPMKTRIVAAISDNDVTAFTSESNVTLASIVFYEIYACS